MLTIYRRFKNGDGSWQTEKVKEGRGIHTSAILGKFFVRPFVGGKQERRALLSESYLEAKQEALEVEKQVEAESKGLTVSDLDAARNGSRTPVKTAVESYLLLKANKRPKTLAKYRTALNRFVESLDGVRFLDEIDVDVLRNHKNFMEGQGYAGKSVSDDINIVSFMLKKNGIKARLPSDERPEVDTEPAVPYSEDTWQKMLGEMTKEDEAVYRFFRGTACRDQEVSYATWADIDFQKKTYHVRSKPEVGFTVKKHESRSIPMPDSLIKLLLARKQKADSKVRWIFANRDGGPRNHFLLKWKKIALRAGVNCGHCKTTVTKGNYDKRKKVDVTCATDPVCVHHFLHRIRKTCATRWHENGVPIRTIQHYLGHKSLETTQLYLGVTDSDQIRDEINAAAGD